MSWEVGREAEEAGEGRGGSRGGKESSERAQMKERMGAAGLWGPQSVYLDDGGALEAQHLRVARMERHASATVTKPVTFTRMHAHMHMHIRMHAWKGTHTHTFTFISPLRTWRMLAWTLLVQLAVRQAMGVLG